MIIDPLGEKAFPNLLYHTPGCFDNRFCKVYTFLRFADEFKAFSILTITENFYILFVLFREYNTFM